LTMSIEQDSDFALNLRLTFQYKRPRKVIETGTYLGMGTTTLIARALEVIWESPDREGIQFHTIELDPDSHESAKCNLANFNAIKFWNGLSVPRALLPCLQEIKERCVDNLPAHIAADHPPHERAFKYYVETSHAQKHGVPDDLLGHALEQCHNSPDFVLLDSGGHIGLVEFEYLISRLGGPCTIMLDDVFHIKHYTSLNKMLHDPRFEIRCLSHEKYGFAIADFAPAGK
jgi:hypothetical protein